MAGDEPQRRSRSQRLGEVGPVTSGLLLIAAGVDNVAVSILDVRLPRPGALGVQVVFVLAGVAVLLRGLEGLWGIAVRALLRSVTRGVGKWR
jgi:hypothetical protein